MNAFGKKLFSLFTAAVMLAAPAGSAFADGPAAASGDDDLQAAQDYGGSAGADDADAVLHVKYINGYPDGTVKPDSNLTKAEAAQMLYNLRITAGPPEENFYASPVITRGDFADMIIAAREELAPSDILTGYQDGSLRLEQNLTRAEGVTMINRALGRSADRFAIATSSDIRVIPDMKSTHWAYYELIEAMTEHSCAAQDSGENWVSHEPGTVSLEEGWYHINGELFHVNADGLFDYNRQADGLKLNEDGRYTTDNYRLDPLLTAEIQKIIGVGMTQREKLRAVYDYMMENYGYRAADTVEQGASGWEDDMAAAMLESGKGNCYSWAAAFTYLARKCGYNAQAVVGRAVSPKGSEREHAWTEITIDGVLYTFDPEIEGVYARNNGESYSLYMKRYGEAAWTYYKPETEPEDPDAADVLDQAEPDGELCGIIDRIYEGTSLEGTDMNRMALTADTEMYAFGVMGVEYEAGVISEPMISPHAHSVVLMRMKEGADIEAARKAIKEHADPNKWICVGVADDDVRVESEGDYVILIMDNESQVLVDNFYKVVKG